MKILVADGDTISRLSLVKVLDMQNLDHVQKADGDNALKEYKKDPDINMVFLDWDLMGSDGLEVTKQIREYEKTSNRDSYIIIITERSGKWDIAKAIEMGADDFITKPMDKNIILERLKTGSRHLLTLETLVELRSLDPVKQLLEEHKILRFQAKKITEFLDDMDHQAPYKMVDWMSGTSFVHETDMHQEKEAHFSVAFLDRIARESRVRFMSYTESNIGIIEKEHLELEELVVEIRNSFKTLKEEIENPGNYSKEFNIMEHTKDYPVFCVKCKKKVELTSPELFTMENGLFAFKGICPDCSSKTTRIIGKSIGVSQKHIVLKRSLNEYLEILKEHLQREENHFFPFASKYLTPGDKERIIYSFKIIEDKAGLNRLGKTFNSS